MKQNNKESFNSLCAQILLAYNSLLKLRKQLQTDNVKILCQAICSLVDMSEDDCLNFLDAVVEFEAEAKRRLNPKQPRDIKALACFYLARNVDTVNQKEAAIIARNQIKHPKQTDYFNS